MARLDVAITGYIAGDDLEIRRTVTDLPDAIAVAWLTIKRSPIQADDDATIQKRITAVDAPGTGQIVSAGGPESDGDLRFDLTQEDTDDLETAEWIYDIQVKCSSGKIYTLERGTIRLSAGVTRATT